MLTFKRTYSFLILLGMVNLLSGRLAWPDPAGDATHYAYAYVHVLTPEGCGVQGKSVKFTVKATFSNYSYRTGTAYGTTNSNGYTYIKVGVTAPDSWGGPVAWSNDVYRPAPVGCEAITPSSVHSGSYLVNATFMVTADCNGNGIQDACEITYTVAAHVNVLTANSGCGVRDKTMSFTARADFSTGNYRTGTASGTTNADGYTSMTTTVLASKAWGSPTWSLRVDRPATAGCEQITPSYVSYTGSSSSLTANFAVTADCDNNGIEDACEVMLAEKFNPTYILHDPSEYVRPEPVEYIGVNKSDLWIDIWTEGGGLCWRFASTPTIYVESSNQ